MRKQPEFRVGVGYDSHRLEADRPLIVGGITIPFELGLKGHSDGDVLLHAITDALCGAAGLPDIGQLFPDTEQRWLNADSWLLLREVGSQVRSQGWEPVNVDAILIAERPKISPHVGRMRERIAEALNIASTQINVRGKTAEGMDAVGAGKGMAAHAVCLLTEIETSKIEGQETTG